MKDKLQHTFLYKCYRDFKLLFAIVAVWAVGTLWFALHSREEFPFLLFGMYSLKEEAKEEYERYSLLTETRGELVYAQLLDAQRELLQSAICKQAARPFQQDSFRSWSLRCITKGEEFVVVQRRYVYNANGHPVNTPHFKIIYPYDSP